MPWHLIQYHASGHAHYENQEHIACTHCYLVSPQAWCVLAMRDPGPCLLSTCPQRPACGTAKIHLCICLAAAIAGSSLELAAQSNLDQQHVQRLTQSCMGWWLAAAQASTLPIACVACCHWQRSQLCSAPAGPLERLGPSCPRLYGRSAPATMQACHASSAKQ